MRKSPRFFSLSKLHKHVFKLDFWLWPSTVSVYERPFPVSLHIWSCVSVQSPYAQTCINLWLLATLTLAWTWTRRMHNSLFLMSGLKMSMHRHATWMHKRSCLICISSKSQSCVWGCAQSCSSLWTSQFCFMHDIVLCLHLHVSRFLYLIMF